MTKFIYFLNQKSVFIGLILLIISSNFLPAENNPLLSSNNIEFKNSTYENFGPGKEKVILKSKEGSVNLDHQHISLNGDIEGKFTLDEKSFSLIANSLSGDLMGKSIYSEEQSVFLAKGFEILSSTMVITQTRQDGFLILFMDAHLSKINSKSKINKGKANKIEFFPSKDLILMEGEAEFFEDNMKIMSDEIHYDLNEDRILKSVNAKIINNL